MKVTLAVFLWSVIQWLPVCFQVQLEVLVLTYKRLFSLSPDYSRIITFRQNLCALFEQHRKGIFSTIYILRDKSLETLSGALVSLEHAISFPHDPDGPHTFIISETGKKPVCFIKQLRIEILVIYSCFNFILMIDFLKTFNYQ